MAKYIFRFFIVVLLLMLFGNCATVYIGLSNYEENVKSTANVKAKFILPENNCELEANDVFSITIEDSFSKTIVIHENFKNQEEIVLPLIGEKKYSFKMNFGKAKPFRYGCGNEATTERLISEKERYEKGKKSERKTRYILTPVWNVLFTVYFWLLWPLGVWPAVFYESTLPVEEVVAYDPTIKEKDEPKEKSKPKSVKGGKFKSLVKLKNGEILKDVEVVVTSDSVVVMTEDGTSKVYKKSEVVSVKK